MKFQNTFQLCAILFALGGAVVHGQVTFTGVYGLTGPDDVTSPGGIAAMGTSFDGLQGLPADAFSFIPKSTQQIGDVTFNVTSFAANNAFDDGYISLSGPIGAGTDGGFNSTSPAYNSVLAGVAYVFGANVGTITIGSAAHPLVTGQMYQVQLFDAAGSNDSALFTGGAGAANSVALTGDDYALGTFTATGSTQVITFKATDVNNNAGVLSAIDVRAIPEPSVYASLAVGLVALALIKRLRTVTA